MSTKLTHLRLNVFGILPGHEVFALFGINGQVAEPLKDGCAQTIKPETRAPKLESHLAIN
ncbi:MAG: hypothetical protein KBD67_01625 [Anaerolineaceae bacterium]|nr:hypothetical protein [Anaerolineaceae bacterium]